MSPRPWIGFALLEIASIGLSAYHGYRRSGGDAGSAIGWGIIGAVFPVATPVVALAQGYGKPR